ncbi:MAG: mercuric ion transport protein [Paracoccaceae bacterium]|jgi:mercuric ion transport protein
MLKFGVIGTVVAALCCFTPVLVLLFGLMGLSALVGYLDFVLFPALAIFILLTGYAYFKRGRT